MIRRRHDKKKEWTRNILLIILAVGVVYIFFNLDIMRKGESVFSQTADKKLKFSGDLTRNDYGQGEFNRLLRFIKRHDSLIDSATIEVSGQDSYRKITNASQVIFEVRLRMSDGATIATPTRRTTRKELVTEILAKLNKDMKAYRQMIKDGKKVKSLVNTM